MELKPRGGKIFALFTNTAYTILSLSVPKYSSLTALTCFYASSYNAIFVVNRIIFKKFAKPHKYTVRVAKGTEVNFQKLSMGTLVLEFLKY